jgi:sterol 3beta-glucosyltransferase
MKIGMQSWGSEGDIRVFTSLAAGLSRAGHDVTLVISDNAGRDYSAIANRYGFALRALPVPPGFGPQELVKLWKSIIDAGNPLKQVDIILTHGFDPILESMYNAARTLCADNELMIGHFFVFPLAVAAEKASVPFASVNVVHNCIPSRYICPPGLPDLGRWYYPLGWKLVRKIINRVFLPRVNRLRVREGLTPHSDVMSQTWASNRLNLLAVSPTICNRPPDWEKRHKVCGFFNLPNENPVDEWPQSLAEFLDNGIPPVYFTFGSMMIPDIDDTRKLLDIWLDSVKLVDCRAIIQIPADIKIDLVSNKRVFYLNRSPYITVFPRCAAVVHHGGAGTTQASLLAGRPSVVVAHIADQTFWGSELQRLGVAGKPLQRKSLTSKKLADAIRYVLSHPEFAVNAEALGHQIAGEDGVATAVKMIEDNFKS